MSKNSSPAAPFHDVSRYFRLKNVRIFPYLRTALPWYDGELSGALGRAARAYVVRPATRRPCLWGKQSSNPRKGPYNTPKCGQDRAGRAIPRSSGAFIAALLPACRGGDLRPCRKSIGGILQRRCQTRAAPAIAVIRCIISETDSEKNAPGGRLSVRGNAIGG